MKATTQICYYSFSQMIEIIFKMMDDIIEQRQVLPQGTQDANSCW
jgi:hypothetical protein